MRMRSSARPPFTLSAVLGLGFASALGCGTSGQEQLSLGQDDGGPSFVVGPGSDASTSSLLVSASPGDPVLCAGACVALSAQAAGGKAPYSYKWSDGLASDDGVVTVCPSATTMYTVTATDSSGHSGGEFTTASLTGTAKVTVSVSSSCSEGGTGGSLDAGLAACDPEAAAPGIGPQTIEVDANGSTRYVMNGATLPPGKYQAQWTDGCMRYAVGGPMFGWDVNDRPPAVFAGPLGVSTMDPGYCVVVDAQNNIVTELPGLTGFGTSDYASCVVQVSSTRPVEFSFPGGEMGVLANDFGAGDNVQGESADGVSPTWRITFLSACP